MSEKTMEENIDEKIKIALNLIRTNLAHVEAINFTQAVLNLAHAKSILILSQAATTPKKQGAGAA